MNAASFAHAQSPLMFHGIKIITSPLLPLERSKRGIVPKPWHNHRGTGNYADRVRKKWRKRFGTEQVNMIMAGDQCFVSAAMAVKLLKEKV